MKYKVVTGIMLASLLIGMLTLTLNTQPVKASGTIYIRADGSVDPTTAPISSIDNITYTFTGNINEPIVVERDNIVVDGAGYTLRGSRSGAGIYLAYRRNVTIKNVRIEGFSVGISLYESSNSKVVGSDIATNTYLGIGLSLSSNNILSGNNITNNGGGIVLSWSSNNSLYDNSLDGNLKAFHVHGDDLSHYLHSINNSNLVDGKPVYYLVNQTDFVITPATHPHVGYLALINCVNASIKDLTLTNKEDGILLAYTTISRIEDNNITNNDIGIVLYRSSNNTISGNNITDNGGGVWLEYSSSNNISGNNLANYGEGIGLEFSCNNTLSGNTITNNDEGIVLYWLSEYNRICGNVITANILNGIMVDGTSNNIISGNNITSNNELGIYVLDSSNNTISENTITNNMGGIEFWSASNNVIYHNNLVDNTEQVYSYDSVNVWDNGYPYSGNYWSDHNPPDIYSGPYQNETGSDGIGDTPYVIDENNLDRYPLMNPYQPVGFNATKNGENYTITAVSNSTITNFNFSYPLQKMSFNVTGSSNTTGYCNIILPKDLINDTIAVLVNGNPVHYNMEENATHFFIYFTYSHSTSFIEILATILGDVNGDRIVDIFDVVLCGLAYGSKPGKPNWNPIVDIRQDGLIDIFDLVIIGIHYGETW